MPPGDTNPRPRAPAFWLGAAFLLIALACSSMLAAKRFGATLPGCGVRSACDALERTIWGTIPGLAWPVSFLGAAYFAAMLAPWLARRGLLPNSLLWPARAAALFSAVYITVILSLGELCPYCLGVHTSNFAFVAAMETIRLQSARRRAAAPAKGKSMRASPHEPPAPRVSALRAGTLAGVVFLLVSAGLGWADLTHQRDLRDKAEAQRRSSAASIIHQGSSPSANVPQDPNDRWGPAGFTGRYHRGPDAAPIRIVMLTDYQCPDCKRVEAEAEQVMASRKDVSLSIKHFPICLEAAPGVPCNKYAGRTLHPNACWAARAAEAAGILGGDDAFWKMHAWLFAKEGRFETSEALAEGVRQAGLDPAVFEPVMAGPETIKRIQADVQDGVALGLYFTPMVFINGVELRGWQTPGALAKTVEEVATSNPPARTAAADRPALAPEKYVGDWREQPVQAIPTDPSASAIIDPPAAGTGKTVEVLVFGDYQEPFTAAADRDIRAAAAGFRVRYTFRVYPANRDCNPALPPNVAPQFLRPASCIAARAAFAARSLGGPVAYRKAHNWLMNHQEGLTEAAVRSAAAEFRLDGAALVAEMNKPETAEAIATDCRAAQQAGLSALPDVFVNGKWVPRPTRDGDNVLKRIIEEAAK